MPAVVVDSSVLITLAAGEQFDLLRDFYSTIHIPPEVWNETTDTAKTFGVHEVLQARADGWLVVQSARDLGKALAHIFHKLVERNGGGSVRRLDSIEPYENTPHRPSANRL